MRPAGGPVHSKGERYRTIFDSARSATPDLWHLLEKVRLSCALLEYLFRRDRQPIGDLSGAVEDFQQMVAQRAAKLALRSAPGTKLDAAEACTAFATDDVAFSHNAENMRGHHDRSKTQAHWARKMALSVIARAMGRSGAH